MSRKEKSQCLLEMWNTMLRLFGEIGAMEWVETLSNAEKRLLDKAIEGYTV